MGMAASQARYLELTARKTDVEYAGQQINQQRTSLANESAGLFSQLMDLVVPTAPSSSDYTTVQYTFNDGNENYTINSISPLNGDPNNNSIVTYQYTQTDYKGIDQTRSDLGCNIVTTVTTTGTTTSTYWLTNGINNQAKLTQCSTTSSTASTDQTAVEQIIRDTGDSSLLAQDYDDYGLEGIYKYTSSSGTTFYYSQTELDALAATGKTGELNNYYAANLSTTISTTSNAYLSKSDSGRYSSITLDGYSTSFDLNAKSVTNEAAYNDAMNNYEYQTAVYQQQVNNINAKTETIEQQDKALEMQLKQLDTEQEALSTELDSVKKVIDKNIEQTFKTFQ